MSGRAQFGSDFGSANCVTLDISGDANLATPLVHTLAWVLLQTGKMLVVLSRFLQQYTL